LFQFIYPLRLHTFDFVTTQLKVFNKKPTYLNFDAPSNPYRLKLETLEDKINEIYFSSYFIDTSLIP
jgi:hypothetical protein